MGAPKVKAGDLVVLNIPKADGNRTINDLWQFNGQTAVVRARHTVGYASYLTLHGVKSRAGVHFAIGDYMVRPADKYAGV